VGIDEKVLKAPRPEYYEMKFEKLFQSKDYLPVSLVAEEENGTVVGFVIGEIYMSSCATEGFPCQRTKGDAKGDDR